MERVKGISKNIKWICLGIPIKPTSAKALENHLKEPQLSNQINLIQIRRKPTRWDITEKKPYRRQQTGELLSINPKMEHEKVDSTTQSHSF